MASAVRIFYDGFGRFSADSNTLYVGTYAFDAATGANVGQHPGSVNSYSDLTADGTAVVNASLAAGATSGGSRQFTVSVTATDLTSGVELTRTTSFVGSSSGYGGLYQVNVLNDDHVLLYGESSQLPQARFLLLDLDSGTFTSLTPPTYGYGALTEDAGNGYVLASISSLYGGSAAVPGGSLQLHTSGLAILDSDGAVVASFNNGITGTATDEQAISAVANKVLQYTGTALNLYDMQLHLQGDILPQIQAQVGPAVLAGLLFSSDGSHLYAADQSTHAIYEFATSDWHLTRSYAVGDVFGSGPFGLRISPDGHFLEFGGAATKV